MWNIYKKKVRNCHNLKRICYRCSDEDLGKRKISAKDKHKKAYAKIFQEKANSNMKERLKTFHQFQSKLKQQHHEKESDQK